MKYVGLVAVVGACALVGCGDDTGSGGAGGGSGGGTTTSGTTSSSSSTTASTTTTTGTTSSTGSGNPFDKSECDSNADCPGGTCIDINLGYRACQYPVIEAVACAGSGFDECCDTSDCLVGTCVLGPVAPFCGGIMPQPYNVCGVDDCATSNDCNGGLCVPAGVVGFKVNRCLSAECTGTACSDQPGMACALVEEPCCGGPGGIYCIDPQTGCQTNDECPNGYCELGVCQPGGPICPG